MGTSSRVRTGLWRGLGRSLVVLSCAIVFTDAVHAVQWARTYGFSNSETATDIRATSDGGFVLSGSIGKYVTGVVLAAQALVVRLDANGNILWQRNYGGVGGEAFSAIRPTADGGYIVAGYTTSFGSGDLDAWVLKLDNAGNVTWQRAYGGTSSDVANVVEPTPDGGYVVAGYTASYGAVNQDAWILKLAANGDVVWQKAYGGGGSANSIQPTSDGGHIVAGYTQSYGAGIADAWVLKLDAAGDISWQRTYGSGFHDEAKSVRQVADGGYVVAGHWGFNYLLGNNWYGEAWVMRLDPAGNLIWQLTRGGNGFDEANAVEPTVDGGYVAVGNQVRGSGYAYEGPRAVLLKLDANGHVVWQRAYSATAASIQVTPDGGYIIGGRSAPTGASGAWALKTDANGAVPECTVMTDVSWTSSESTATVVDSTASATLTHAMPVDTTAIPGDIGLGIEQQCYYSPPASSANYQGLWWNAPPNSESGWGINFAHQGDVIFATWFTYDTTGEASWLVMTANETAEATYTGTLMRTTGPAFNAVPFDPAKVTPTTVGTGTLTFSDPNNGRFAYTVDGVQQAKAITRQVFGPLPTCAWSAQPDLVGATNYQDLWWAPGGTESGWGVNFTHQGDIIFATWFTYDFDGSVLWLAATTPKVGTGVYSGTLYRATGPAFSADPFDPHRVTPTPVGTLTISFADGNAATFAYTMYGVTQTKAITRQVFYPPAATVCSSPVRVPTSVTIASPTPSPWVGETVQLSATVRDQFGYVMEGTATSWSSSNPNVATISTNGALQGLTTGAIAVTVSVGGVSGTAMLTVSPMLRISVSVGATKEVVFDYTTDRCADVVLPGKPPLLDIPDQPARFVRAEDGSLVLIDGLYLSRGKDFGSLKRDCTQPPLGVAYLRTPESYENMEILWTVYREGNRWHGLIHNEFHDDVASTCRPGDPSPSNPCWYNSITYAVSMDGAHSFSKPSPPAHVVAPAPKPGYRRRRRRPTTTSKATCRQPTSCEATTATTMR